MERRLYRSRADRMIRGVCGGLAQYLDLDPTLVRLAVVLLVFADGIGILAYIVMAVIVPLEGSGAKESRETIRENVKEMKKTAGELGEEIRSTFTEEQVEGKGRKACLQRRNSAGIILIVAGLLFLAGNFNFFWWFKWDRLWPLLLVGAGLLFIARSWRRRNE